jgi:hypothetical protein
VKLVGVGLGGSVVYPQINVAVYRLPVGFFNACTVKLVGATGIAGNIAGDAKVTYADDPTEFTAFTRYK